MTYKTNKHYRAKRKKTKNTALYVLGKYQNINMVNILWWNDHKESLILLVKRTV
jgi:hypothetical protein